MPIFGYMLYACLLAAFLVSADNFERVAVVTVAKDGVNTRVTGNVWFTLERKVSRINGVRVLDAGEQTLKLRADSGSLADACRKEVICLSALGARLGVDRLISVHVAPSSRGGFAVNVLIVDVAGQRFTSDLTFEASAGGDLNERVDAELRRVFASRVKSAARAPVVEPLQSGALLPNALAEKSPPPPPPPPAKQKKTAPPPPAPPLPVPGMESPRALASSPIVPAQGLTMREPPAYRPRPLGSAGIAIAVLSVATLATAIGVGASSQALQGAIDDRTGQVTASRLQGDANTRAMAANIAYGVGAAGFALGSTLFAVDLWRYGAGR